MQDYDTGPRPPEATQPPEIVFTELVDRLEATRSEHGGVTFGIRDDGEFGDARIVVLPVPVIESGKYTYVIATVDGPKGLVLDDKTQAYSEENRKRLDKCLREADASGGTVRQVGNSRVGYLSPSKAPLASARVIIRSSLGDGGVEFFLNSGRVVDVDEETTLRAYDLNKASRGELRQSTAKPESIRAASALIQRLGPKPPQ